MARRRKYKARAEAYRHVPGYDSTTDEMQALCWCQSETLWVPRSMIRQGETLPCRRKECVKLSKGA